MFYQNNPGCEAGKKSFMNQEAHIRAFPLGLLDRNYEPWDALFPMEITCLNRA